MLVLRDLPDRRVVTMVDLSDRCENCGERAKDGDMAEVWNPAEPRWASKLVHSSCIEAGWEIA